MASGKSSLTREQVDRLVRQALGLELSSQELERLRQRLHALTGELHALERWLERGSEPLSRVLIEDDEDKDQDAR